MRWNDASDIAICLYEENPELDPLTLSFERLHAMVCSLDGFNDDPEASNEHMLEAILMAWLDERS